MHYEESCQKNKNELIFIFRLLFSWSSKLQKTKDTQTKLLHHDLTKIAFLKKFFKAMSDA